MTTKRIVLWCCIFLLLATPVAAYQFWDDFLQMLGIPVESTVAYPPAAAYPTAKIQEQADSLQELSLDEVFAALLDDQQYFTYIPPTGNRSEDIMQVLTARTFLKVFQQLLELPNEQALEKLHQFSETAIQEYASSLEKSLILIGVAEESPPNPSYSLAEALAHFHTITGVGDFSIRGSKYMLCATMLMAARMGEYELLLNQINAMQTLTDEYLEKMGKGQVNAGSPDSIHRRIASLEDNCLFTILLYALERKEGGLDVDVSPFLIFTPSARQQELELILRQEAEGVPITPHPGFFKLSPKTVHLFRWNAYVTHSDAGIANPRDMVEQITVYAFATPWSGGGGGANNVQIEIDEQMQIVLDSLKERLAE